MTKEIKPMRTTIIALTMFVLIGCTATNPTETNTPNVTATPRSGSGSLFAINEVGLGSNGYVALTNFTDQPAGMSGLYLCQGAQCFALPSVVVAPGATARVAVGDGTGIDGVVATGATIGELRPSDGEIALVASQNVNDPKAMLAYLQWGSTPHALTKLAVDAGLWIESGYAPTAKDATRLFRQETGLWLFDTK